jgi:Toprim domain
MTTGRNVASALGGRRAQRLADGSYLVPCPVPSHGKGRGDRSPSLRIGDGQTRLLVHCFAGCDRLDIIDVLRRRGLLDDRHQDHHRDHHHDRHHRHHADDDRQRREREQHHAAEQHRKAAWMWSQRQPIAGSIAERYLRQIRGVTCALAPTLAFLRPSKPEHHPAMISAFALVDEPEPRVLGEPRGVNAVHLTLLKPDGSGKADVDKPKIIVGRPLGRPITLAPPNDLMGLAITEGIEDALSVHEATGLGAWAAGSAGFMPGLADNVPSYIECITIYVDADKAGQEGAHKLAERLHRRGIEVFLESIAS